MESRRVTDAFVTRPGEPSNSRPSQRWLSLLEFLLPVHARHSQTQRPRPVEHSSDMRRSTVSSRGLVRNLRGPQASLQRRTLATPTSLPEKDCTSITPPYKNLLQNLSVVRSLLGNRPLTLAEKILYSHVYDPEHTLSDAGITRGETYLQLSPERMVAPMRH